MPWTDHSTFQRYNGLWGLVKTRKSHICHYCYVIIRKGNKAFRMVKGKLSSHAASKRICHKCGNRIAAEQAEGK